MSGSKLRICVRMYAFLECLYGIVNLGLSVMLAVLVVMLHFDSEDAKGLMDGFTKNGNVMVAFMPENFNFDGLAVYWLLTIRMLLLFLLSVSIAVCLFRSSAAGRDPLSALQLIRIWRNWTIVLQTLFILEHARKKDGFLKKGFLIPFGLTLLEMALVHWFSVRLHQHVEVDHRVRGKGEFWRNHSISPPPKQNITKF